MKLITAILLTLLLTACSGLQTGDTTSRLAVQYATLKVIENSSGVEARDVVETVEKVRSVVSEDITVDVTKIVEALNLESLPPSDQLLVGALIGSIEIELYQAPLSDDERVARLLTILDWIESAAMLSGD